jgi:hypothetical protein
MEIQGAAAIGALADSCAFVATGWQREGYGVGCKALERTAHGRIDTLQVFQALNRSPNARLEHSAELGDGLAAALWSNHHDAQEYEAPSHHTLSCYIAGGTGTFRRGQPGQGGPDKLCILPADHQSGWVINGDIRLAHLYFSAEQFALGCVTCSIASREKCSCARQTFSKTRCRRGAFGN